MKQYFSPPHVHLFVGNFDQAMINFQNALEIDTDDRTSSLIQRSQNCMYWHDERGKFAQGNPGGPGKGRAPSGRTKCGCALRLGSLF